MFDIIRMIENSLEGYSEAFRLLAANVQNFQTDGYKQVDFTFQTIFNQQISRAGGARYGVNGASNTHNIAQGATIMTRGLDFRQGGLREAKPLNSAIVGQGVFVLKSPGESKFLYTRSSEFLFDKDGYLVDTFQRRVHGYKMVNGVVDKSQLVPIQIDPAQINPSDVGFETNGVLTTNYFNRKAAFDTGENPPEGTTLFQIGLAAFPNPSGLTIRPGNAFEETILSGAVTSFGVSGDAGFGSVSGGFAEASNVNPAETTITGIQLQRGYNAVQSALQLVNRALQSFISAITAN